MARFFTKASQSPDLGSVLRRMKADVEIKRKKEVLKGYGNDMLDFLQSLPPEQKNDIDVIRKAETEFAKKYGAGPEIRQIGGNLITSFLSQNRDQINQNRQDINFQNNQSIFNRGVRDYNRKESDKNIINQLSGYDPNVESNTGIFDVPAASKSELNNLLSFDGKQLQKKINQSDEDRKYTLEERKRKGKQFDFNEKIDNLKLSNEELRQKSLSSSQKEQELNKKAIELFNTIRRDTNGDSRAIQSYISSIPDEELKSKVISLFENKKSSDIEKRADLFSESLDNRTKQAKLDSLTKPAPADSDKKRKAWLDQYNKELEFNLGDRAKAKKNTEELLGYSISEPNNVGGAQPIKDPKPVFESVLGSFDKKTNGTVDTENKTASGNSDKKIEQLSVDQIRDLKNIKTRFGKTETASTTPLTAIQNFASQTQPDKSPVKQFGETEIEAVLRYTGIATKLQDRKEIAKMLRKKFPEATDEQIAEMIIKSVTPTTE